MKTLADDVGPLLVGQSFQMADLLDNAAEQCSAKVV